MEHPYPHESRPTRVTRQDAENVLSLINAIERHNYPHLIATPNWDSDEANEVIISNPLGQTLEVLEDCYMFCSYGQTEKLTKKYLIRLYLSKREEYIKTLATDIESYIVTARNTRSELSPREIACISVNTYLPIRESFKEPQ